MDAAMKSRPDNSTKFRQSCDRCQDSKVRCSRDKPVCKRCARRGYHCFYSLLRRTGRPRKVATRDADTSLYSVEKVVGKEQQGNAVFYASPTLSLDRFSTPVAATIAGTNTLTAHEVPTSSQATQDAPVSLVTNDTASRSVFNTCNSDHERSNVPSSMFQNDASTRTPPSTYDARNYLSDCYTEILAQASRLEQRIKKSTSLPTIDVVLEGEGVFQRLQQYVSQCGGHLLEPLPNESGSLVYTPAAEKCLATGRPVLLSLAVLAERIVGMLEDMFREAAKTAQSIDQVNDFVWFAAPSSTLDLSARRSQRSLRNLQNKPCVALEVESYRALRLDDFVVHDQAKIDAMGRILKLRVSKMLRTLKVLDRETQRKQSERQHEKGQLSVGPLNWDSSMPLMDTMSGKLLNDLVRRMESLQGAMILI